MSSDHAIVLAGGLGSRLAPHTYVLPKPLLPVGRIPILEVILRQLRAGGIGVVHLAVGYLAELIQSYFGDGTKHGLEIHYYREDSPLGTAAPVRFVLDNWASADPIPERFIVMNGDLLVDLSFEKLLAQHAPGSLSVLVAPKTVRIDLGVLELSESGRVVDYIEKPDYSFRISTGVYVFSSDLVSLIRPFVRLDLPDFVRQLLADRVAVESIPLESVGSLWLDLGRPDDYAEGTRLFDEDPGRFLPADPRRAD